MTDYIERDAVLEEIAYWETEFTECDYVFPNLRRDVRHIPAAEVRPVVRSRWKLLTNGDGICQHCGSLQKHIWDPDGWQNFCGHCGADMREG